MLCPTMSPALPLKNCATSVCRAVRSAPVAVRGSSTSWKSNAYAALVIGSGPSTLIGFFTTSLSMNPSHGPRNGAVVGCQTPGAGARWYG